MTLRSHTPLPSSPTKSTSSPRPSSRASSSSTTATRRVPSPTKPSSLTSRPKTPLTSPSKRTSSIISGGGSIGARGVGVSQHAVVAPRRVASEETETEGETEGDSEGEDKPVRRGFGGSTKRGYETARGSLSSAAEDDDEEDEDEDEDGVDGKAQNVVVCLRIRPTRSPQTSAPIYHLSPTQSSLSLTPH
ncbi:hypothetical protein P7C70_g8334, partial [Phenoliferia sp. Uapishka_3]